jgi:hypothetical protein
MIVFTDNQHTVCVLSVYHLPVLQEEKFIFSRNQELVSIPVVDDDSVSV